MEVPSEFASAQDTVVHRTRRPDTIKISPAISTASAGAAFRYVTSRGIAKPRSALDLIEWTTDL
jgi:hypothetical protein